MGGGDGAIDCIGLVYEVRHRLGLACPPFDPHWYESKVSALRFLLRWGEEVERPYDGDIVWHPSTRLAFGAVWDNGVLCLSALTQTVVWTPHGSVTGCRYFRERS